MNEQNKHVRKSANKSGTKSGVKSDAKSDLKADSKSDSKLDSQSGSQERPEKGLLDSGIELKKALDAWNELAAQAPTQSADEKLLQDVQQLLKQLKSKIEEFK